MKVVILAGGKGTRLGELTRDIPKPMVPLAGKPILQYQVELCARYGLKDITLVVNHLSEPIVSHFGDGAAFGVDISYFHEEQPLGTVGGIKELEAELQEDFLVLYGDVMMEMDLARLIDFHRQKQSEATLVVHPNDHPYDSDLVELDEEERVVKVLPKPHPAGLRYHNMVNAAVYIFAPVVLQKLEKGRKADFGKDIFPHLYQSVRMFGYNTPEYLKDMGTPDRKEQVEQDILSGKVMRRSLAQPQKAFFLDRDGVINYDTDLIHRPEDFTLYPFAAEAIRRINRSDYISVVTTNQSVVARNLTTLQGLAEIHKKMETELGEAGAKLDDIRFCPHHPDSGYPGENVALKIDCECRKPKAGMHRAAAAKFHIDLQQSWMIGDSERDTLAGKAAGCRTIGVMTGHGQKKISTPPDYLFGNLREAVDFILDEPYAPVLEKLLPSIKDCSEKPFVISIGGNSRSGKSSLATYLRQELVERRHDCLSIELDDWIRPKAEREGRDEVFHNFQIGKLEGDVAKILNGESVELQAYQPHPERPLKKKHYQYRGEAVVIIEGVVALSSEALRQLAHHSIFISIDEAQLKERFEEFYRWKGYDEASLQQLWKERLENEYRVIAQDAPKADRQL